MTDMSPKPIRVQRRRAKGWKMPPNTVCVDRTTKWGNPFRVNHEQGWTQEYVVKLFHHMLAGSLCLSASNPSVEDQKAYRHMVMRDGAELAGKNLACWCSLDKPCHADVLLTLRQPRKRRHTSAEQGNAR